MQESQNDSLQLNTCYLARDLEKVALIDTVMYEQNYSNILQFKIRSKSESQRTYSYIEKRNQAESLASLFLSEHSEIPFFSVVVVVVLKTC